MTKVCMYEDERGGLMFDCLNHADDHDVCTIMSTLCNVLVEATFRAGYEPTDYHPGHVRIDLPPNHGQMEIFNTVKAVIDQAARQHPEYIKVY